jgi:hypothetical protein
MLLSFSEAVDQPDQRREGFQLGQIAGRPEDHQCVDAVSCHACSS